MAANFRSADLTRYKKEINPAPIISKRIKIQRVNDEWLGCCPDVFHKANLGKSDSHPSFTIYKLANGTWGYKCFSCGANGNVFQFVQAIDKISFPAAVRRVLEEAGVEGWQNGSTQDEVNVPTEAAAPKDHVTFPITQYQPAVEALEHAPEGQAWLRKRGISMETARQFKIGFVQSVEKISPNHSWANQGWVLFPTMSADGRTVNAVKYRSLVAKKDKMGDKEVSGILRALNTSTSLFNAQTVTSIDDVWIVEGEPDVLVLAQAGVMAVGYPSACYTPSDCECELLSSAKRIFLAGDNDLAGTKTMAALQKRLPGATFLIKWPNNRKDANDVLTHECSNDQKKFKTLIEELQARATQTEIEPVFLDADTIQPTRIEWLWPERIPFGKLTLFAGNPDNGKSLASTDVAARVTNGAAFPDAASANPPATVLMMLGEDDLKDTAVPRLIAAGADMKRIKFLVAVRPIHEPDRAVRLDTDLRAIEKKLEIDKSIRLVIIDPISNYLGKASMVNEQDVRSILIPLKRMAETFGVAVVLVMHLNKKSDLDAISRVGGAMAFIGVARCSWLFQRDPKEEPAEGNEMAKERKLDTFSMLRIKNNLASFARAGLSYSVAVRPVPMEEGPDALTPYVVWGGEIDGDADEALRRGRCRSSAAGTPHAGGRPSVKLQQAKAWLQNALQDGERHPIKTLQDDAKTGFDFSRDTLERAYKDIGGLPAERDEHDTKVWCWRLPRMNARLSEVESNFSDLFDSGGAV